MESVCYTMGIRNGTHFYLENSGNGTGKILSGKNKKK
jgi:hypothetical protein